MPSRRTLAALSAFVLGIVAAGCSGGNDADPNYKAQVVLTPEQQAAEKANMAGQAAPGQAPDRGAPAATMPMPPGKGK